MFKICLLLIIITTTLFPCPLYAQGQLLYNDTFKYYYMPWREDVKLSKNNFKAWETKQRNRVLKTNGYTYISGDIDKYLDSSNNVIGETIDVKLKNEIDSLFYENNRDSECKFIINAINKSHYKIVKDSFILESCPIYVNFRLLMEVHRLEDAYHLQIDSNSKNDMLFSVDDSTILDENTEGFAIQKYIFRPDDNTIQYNIFAMFLPYQSCIESNTILNLIHQQNRFDECEVYARKLRKGIIQCLNRKNIKDYDFVIDSLINDYEIDDALNAIRLKYEKDNYNRKIPYSSKLKKEQLWSEKIKKELESLKEYEKPEGTIIVKKRK